MGRGKAWTPEESTAVAHAWRIVMANGAATSHGLAHALYAEFLKRIPANASAEGHWRARPSTAVRSQFDHIQEDILRFNTLLKKIVKDVQAAHAMDSSGTAPLSEDVIVRAAIGVHTGVTKTPEFDFSSDQMRKITWKLYGAWSVLRGCPQYEFPSINPGTPVSSRLQRTASRSTTRTNNPNTSTRVEPPATVRKGNVQRHVTSTPATREKRKSTVEPPGQPVSKGVRGSNTTSGIGNSGGMRKESAEVARIPPTNGAPSAPVGNGNRIPQTSTPASPSAPIDPMRSIAEAIQGFSDVLAEHNAITLFSRPELAGSMEQKLFYQAMAEKHVLKAKLERDRLVNALALPPDSSGGHT